MLTKRRLAAARFVNEGSNIDEAGFNLYVLNEDKYKAEIEDIGLVEEMTMIVF